MDRGLPPLPIRTINTGCYAMICALLSGDEDGGGEAWGGGRKEDELNQQID